MHFKKLELFGFKSFADKTALHFEPGVTAIVGPNGCGKSNILDAIRWVMGEQNPRDLRGSAMADVIFNGSDKKDPLNFAEVSLTFANESRILPIEYDEITITRRLFRSGESEYLLNKTPVRLRDITELFMDTGLGSEGYWIMEQGKIDLILSSRPEDRRSVFEEASGINKYKAKKKEALRKLEQTEQNLLRLSDIISEVRRQINSIERQAQKAKRYRDLFEKLKEMDVKVTARSYNELKKSRESLLSERASLQEKERALASQEAELSQKVSEQRSKLEELNQRLSSFDSEIRSLSSTIERNIDRINLDNERIIELELRRNILAGEVAALNEKLGVLGVRVEKLRAEVAQIENERESRAQELALKEQGLREIAELVERTRNDVSKAKFEVVEVASRESRAKNELAKFDADINNLGVRLRRLGTEKEKLQNECAVIKEKYDVTLRDEQAQKEKVEGARQRVVELETQLNCRLEGHNALKRELDEAQNEQALKAAKLESLLELHRRREGYSSGVRFLMQAKEQGAIAISGIHGVVADLIEAEPGFEAALEVALGDDVEAIVVDSQAVALEAMNHLSSNGQGKAKFICMDRLNGADSSSAVQHPGALGAARNFVKCNAAYDSLMAYLFEDTCIVNDIGFAIEASKNAEFPRRIVTKLGEVVEGACIVGGGRHEAGILGREARIKELEREVESLKEKITGLKEQEISDATSIEALQKDLYSGKFALHESEVALANKGSVLDAVSAERKKLDDEYALISLEYDETQQEQSAYRSREENLKNELTQIELARQNLESVIENGQALIAQKAKAKEELLVWVAQMQAELNLIQQRESSHSATLGMLSASYDSDNNSRLAKEKEAQESGSRVVVLTQEIAQLEAQNAELASKKESLQSDSRGLLERKNEFLEIMSACEAQAGSIRNEVEQARDRLRDVEVRDAQLGFDATSVRERILQAYQVDLDQVASESPVAPDDSIEQPTPAEDWDSINQEIVKIREKLKDMGPVNLVAIQEEEELASRYNFLTAQESDLLQAKDSLVKAIQKINKTTKELFLDGFQKVQVTFREYFRMLFGGGEAELIILDESDVLESGIEIVVRPPGKKLQNISLLSGGEKALCAIALLFAIFKVKPSPFCILDEMDAPLDESNIDRFTKVLGEFVKTSQFIMITHNKKTISVADIMYGVTMEGSGVSKIVSVKFQEAPAAKTA